MLIEVHHENFRGDIITLRQELVIKFNGKMFVVPAGFECDGASVPRFLWDSISPQIHPATLQAAVAHDFLYRNQVPGWSRKEADLLFYTLCRQNGLSWWKSQKAYLGLRLFGGNAWKGKKE